MVRTSVFRQAYMPQKFYTLFSLLLSKLEVLFGWDGLSFSCPECDLIWYQYSEFVTAVLQTGQFA
jgi:hypothetical protein